jgi:hypothetical protein
MLITFLWKNMDVFTWQISDMPRILMEVIEHKLDIDPSYKLIKQKKEDTHQRDARPSSRKSINSSKLGSLGQ